MGEEANERRATAEAAADCLRSGRAKEPARALTSGLADEIMMCRGEGREMREWKGPAEGDLVGFNGLNE